MFFKTLGLTSALLLMAGASFLSSHAPYGGEESHHKISNANHVHASGYVKPGAGVMLSDDYDGQTGAGEIETIMLSLSHLYDEGYLTVALIPSPELHIISDMTPQHFQLSQSSVVSLPVQVSGSTEGNYSLGLEAIYESPDGHQSRRVLSIPVNIGTTRLFQKTRPSEPKTFKAWPASLIALPAREVIE